MREQPKQNWIGWGFMALLAALCAVLTILQYRWTGEVSRAEAEKLRGGISDQAQQFGNAFDAALTKSCSALVPREEALNDQNRESVHQGLYKKWKAGHPRPLFSHLDIAVPDAGGVRLFEFDQISGKLESVAWPPEWEALRQNLESRNRNGTAPYEDPAGRLLQFPVFGGPPPNQKQGPPEEGDPPEGGPPGENEWVILELATNYLGNTWLPELTRRYLNLNGQTVYDIVVATVAAPKTVVYCAPADAVNNAGRPVEVRFNHEGRDPENYHGPSPDARWRLEVRPHPGALESVVATARWRDLAVSVALNGLILAAGLALLRHTRRSRQLAEAQLNFVANVSHELRTPLTVIRGAAHNLKRGVVSERSQIEKYAGLIIQHAEQLGEMVEQVLQLAGAKKNHAAAVRQPVALGEVLSEAIAATTHDTEAAHCQVQLELPPSLPVLTGDAAALRRVFQNLIANAAKHGGQGGWIGVTAVHDEDGRTPVVEIQVADCGPGIPPDELNEIFQPFFRGALARALQLRGSGLGLSLVREIVETHGGSISVRSEKGGGTTFTVRLPVTATGRTK